MKAATNILDMTPLGMKFTVLKSGADTHGKSLDMHWELRPGCNLKDPLIHLHPHAMETYEILAGDMEFFIRDKWVTARQGDYLTVPKGVQHAFRNPGSQPVYLLNTHQPALNMERYFEDVCKVLDKLTRNRTKTFSMNLQAKLYLGVLMSRYRNDIVATHPPDGLIRLLGAVGNMLGLRY